MTLTPGEHEALDAVIAASGVTNAGGFAELLSGLAELRVDGPDADGLVWVHGRRDGHLHSVNLGAGELGAAALTWWRARG